MKIASISPGAFSVPPVVGTSVEHVIQKVAEQLKREHEVIVYTRKCPQFPVSAGDGGLFYKRIKYANSRFYLKRVTRDLLKNEPDIIIIENRPSYVMKVKEALPWVPIILNMHSDVYSLPSYISREEMMRVSEQVDGLITNSKALEQYFLIHYPSFSGKSMAIHLGIDMADYEKGEQSTDAINELRKKYGIRQENLTLLFAGRLVKKKGLHLVLNIMPELIATFPNIKLLIAGSPRYGKDIHTRYVKEIMKNIKMINDHVIFTGFIEPDQMPHIYQLADIVVTPSIWNEPFLLVNLEAMASGKPVVTSNMGGITEVVKHGENGLVFSPDHGERELLKHLSLLLESETLRIEYGNRGRSYAKERSWERTANEYIHFMTKLVKQK